MWVMTERERELFERLEEQRRITTRLAARNYRLLSLLTEVRSAIENDPAVFRWGSAK